MTPSINYANATLLVKTSHGVVATFRVGQESEPLVEEFVYGVTAFDNYLDKTIFYGTTKPNQPINSLSNEYTGLIEISGPWGKTALAVDFISEKIYLIDSETQLLNIIDLRLKSYGIVLSDLNEPKDIVLDPERKLMFILQSSSVK